MRPLIVGEAPGRAVGRPIEGRCAAVLLQHARLDARACQRTNLLREWPGPQAKGSAYSEMGAKLAAFRMRGRLRPGRIVLLLGKRVARSFRVKPVYLVEQQLGGARVFVLPHPSGINRWWNASANRQAARALIERLRLAENDPISEPASGRSDKRQRANGAIAGRRNVSKSRQSR